MSFMDGKSQLKASDKEVITNGGIARRTMLGASLSLVAVSFLQLHNPDSAQAVENAASLALQSGEGYGFAPDWSGALPALVPLALVLKPKTSSREFLDSTVEVSWNSSIAAVQSDFIVIVAGESVSLAKYTLEESDGISTISFSVEEIKGGATADSLVCNLPISSRLSYPADQISGEYVPSARVILPDRQVLETESSTSLRPEYGEVWGSELSILWSSIPGASDEPEQRTLPRSISIVGTGPSSVPAGTSVTIEVAPAGNLPLAVGAAYWGHDEEAVVNFGESWDTTEPSKTTLKVVINEPILSGQSIRIDFFPLEESQQIELAQQLNSCLVSFLAPEGAQLKLVRATGSTSQGWTKE